jgi:hypothetical protein
MWESLYASIPAFPLNLIQFPRLIWLIWPKISESQARSRMQAPCNQATVRLAQLNKKMNQSHITLLDYLPMMV